MTTDLLTRLEAAKEGSRELDAEIGQFTGDPYADAEYYCYPPYTTSLDAITGLIERELPGWTRLSCSDGWASIWMRKKGLVESIHAPTEPLALCIAFVKAKEAKDE